MPTTPPKTFASVSLCRVNDFPEKKKDADGVSTLNIDQDCFGARKGKVSVGKWEKDKTLEITADVDISKIKDTGLDVDDDSGSVTVTISAGWCKPLEDAIDDFEKLQQALIDNPPTGG